MNICHDGGPVVAFRDPWPSRAESEQPAPRPADPEWCEYCRARERAERAAAKTATSLEARRIHQQLAQAYAAQLRLSTGG